MKSSLHYLEAIKGLSPLDEQAPDRINNPERLREAIGEPIAYSAAVEGETNVSGQIITTVLPRLDEVQLEFVEWWDLQERVWHGGAQSRLLTNIDMQQMSSPDSKVSETHEKIGAYAARFKIIHTMVESAVMGVMAAGEYETIHFYGVIENICRSIGEDAIADMFKIIKLQERAHMYYERARAIEGIDRMSGPLKYLPGLALKQMYLPVGVDAIGSDRSDRFADLLTSTMAGRRTLIEEGLAKNMSFYPGIRPNSGFVSQLYADIVSARDNSDMQLTVA